MKRSVLWSILSALVISAAPAVGQEQKVSEVRRVVTKIDASGKAVVMFDARVPMKSFRSPNPAGDMWISEKGPPDFSWTEDRANIKIGLVPPKNGNVFRIVDFVPINPEVEKGDINLMMKVVGDHAPAKGLPPRHPMMHRTRSLDYAIIMSGEIDMLLDEGEVHLKAGDVVVQQATNHAWINRGKEICRIAFILIDSEEP